MVSLSGVMLGGAADNRLARGQLEQQSQEIQNRKLDSIITSGENQIADFIKRAEQIKSRSLLSPTPQIDEALQNLRSVAVGTAKQIESLDPSRSGLAQKTSVAFDAALQGVLSPQEKGGLSGIEAGSKKASESALLEEVGVPRGLAQESAGIAQPKPQTDIGKLVFDRGIVIEQFGENSPQAKAFDEAASLPEQAKLTDISSSRGQFTTLSKDFLAVRDAFSKIIAATVDPTAAGDLAMIFNFMKLLDPGSVVREGEFATAQSAAGVPDRVRSFYNRVVSGERLAENQRIDFIKQSENIFASQIKSQLLLEDQFRGISKRSGMNPGDVVVDFIGDFRSGVVTHQNDAGGDGVEKMNATQILEELKKNPDPDTLKRLEKRLDELGG